jgi:hypothetical protein
MRYIVRSMRGMTGSGSFQVLGVAVIVRLEGGDGDSSSGSTLELLPTETSQ